jgi:hypothetical protein
MKNIRRSLFIFFLTLIATLTVYGQQQCTDYLCVIRKVKKAMLDRNYREAFRQLESADAYPTRNADEITRLRQQLFNAIEKERIDAENARSDAQIQKNLATQAAIIAQLQTDSANIAKNKALESQKTADSLKVIAIKDKSNIEGFLDSITKFSDREGTLKEFNIANDKANFFFQKREWDSSLVYLKTSLKIADANPLIKVGKDRIYAQIDSCNASIIEYKEVLNQISAAAILVKEKTVGSYAKAYDILSRIDTNRHSIAVQSINKFIDSLNTDTKSNSKDFSLKYYLLELYKLRNNDLQFQQIYNELKYESTKFSNRRAVSRLTDSYKLNGLEMKYPFLYDTLFFQRNFFMRKSIHLSLELYVPVLGAISGYNNKEGFGFMLNYEVGKNNVIQNEKSPIWSARSYWGIGYETYANSFHPFTFFDENKVFVSGTGQRYNLAYKIGYGPWDILALNIVWQASFVSEKVKAEKTIFQTNNVSTTTNINNSLGLGMGLEFSMKVKGCSIGYRINYNYVSLTLNQLNEYTLREEAFIEDRWNLGDITYQKLVLRYHFHEKGSKSFKYAKKRK